MTPILGTGADASPAATGTTERVLVSTEVKTYTYVYTGGSLMQETIRTETTTEDGTTETTQTLNYAYDVSGAPMTVTYGGATYYYALNLQGDVMAILNASGTAVVTYTYDAWGNILSSGGTMASTLGTYNPLRYRGYVYDNETELYYLQSRYYNPERGRFLNADALVATGQGLLGNNMLAYCRNNPLNRVDAAGFADEEIFDEDTGTVQVTPDIDGGISYSSFSAFKSAQGSAKPGFHWHHIVEQIQQKLSGFSAESIHNTSNLIQVDAATHAQITGHYNSKQFIMTGGLSVRQWLAEQPYEFQYQYGLQILQRFGVIP